MRMECAGMSDLAKGMHTDDEIRRRIAQGGRIFRMACTRTPDLAHGLQTGGWFCAESVHEFWVLTTKEGGFCA